MRRGLCLAALAVLSLSAAAVPAAAQDFGDEVVDYSAKDGVMNAAIAEARRTLPVFWARQSGRDADGREMLKVALEGANSTEHIWVGRITAIDGGYTALLMNEPADLPGLRRGSPVTFTAEQISDWAYEHKGRLWGAYTMRAMLPDIDPAEAAGLREYLSDTPLETTAR